MGAIKKIEILCNAFKNTEDKKRIPQKVWRALTKGGISSLKHTILSVNNRENTITCNDSDIYDYQQAQTFDLINTEISITLVIEVQKTDTDITGTLDSISIQSHKNINVILLAPNDYTYNFNCTILYYKISPKEKYSELLSMIRDHYFLLINGGNILHKNAIQLFAQSVINKTEAMVYCDECIFDGSNGARVKYFIKPDYSLVNQINNLFIEQGVLLSTEVVRKAGGFTYDYEHFSSRLNDLILRVAPLSRSIIHVSKILLLRNSFTEENIHFENVSIVRSNLRQLGIQRNAIYDNKLILPVNYSNHCVSIIIPTSNYEIIKKTIINIVEKTSYYKYELIIVTTDIICDKLRKFAVIFPYIKFATYNDEFNYSRKCNMGAKIAQSDLLVFLNDSVIIEDVNWLDILTSFFDFAHIGAISPKILREDKTIRYAGIISGGFGLYPIPFNGIPNKELDGINEPVFLNREVSILSATCLAIRKDIFSRIEGFNEQDTPIKFSNVEISYKVKEFGYQCLYCADTYVTVNSNLDWYDSWYCNEDNDAYIYILKKYMGYLEYDPFFTNEMKYKYLKNVPFDTSFFKGHGSRKTGKSILLISHELSLTGAPIALHYAAKALYEKGNHVVLVSPYDGKLREELIADGIDVIIDPSINGSDFWLKWACNFQLIIVSTLVQYNNIIQLQNTNIPVIWWVHEAKESYVLGANKLLPEIVNHNIHIYCGGGYARTVMQEYRPQYKAGELLYCVPDYAKTMTGDYKYKIDGIQDKIVFSIVGTIEERKGQDIFASAIMDMPIDYVKKCRFIVLGRKINDVIYDKVMELKNMYPEEVTLINEVSRDEIKDIYDQSHVIVCASRDDPMPVFMTECLMLSKIAICSENTGTASLLKDGINGYIYRNNDSKELMKKMMFVIDNIHQMDTIKSLGRKTYEQYFTKEAFDHNVGYIVENILNEV